MSQPNSSQPQSIPVIWNNLNEVPPQIKIHQGSCLTLDQVHFVVNDALTIGEGQINMGLGQAWINFTKEHSAFQNAWVPNDVYLTFINQQSTEGSDNDAIA